MKLSRQVHATQQAEVGSIESACFENALAEEWAAAMEDAMSRNTRFAFITLTLGLFCSSAHPAETITYTYDARGRLVKVVRTGTVNNNNQVCYKLDKAGNRTNVKATVNSLPACP